MFVVVSLELQVFHKISWIYQKSPEFPRLLGKFPKSQVDPKFPRSWENSQAVASLVIKTNSTKQGHREFPGILRIAICNFFVQERTQQPGLCRSTIYNRSKTNCLVFESRTTLVLVLNEYSILDCEISRASGGSRDVMDHVTIVMDIAVGCYAYGNMF